MTDADFTIGGTAFHARKLLPEEAFVAWGKFMNALQPSTGALSEIDVSGIDVTELADNPGGNTAGTQSAL